jgi:hypothetical protein
MYRENLYQYKKKQYQYIKYICTFDLLNKNNKAMYKNLNNEENKLINEIQKSGFVYRVFMSKEEKKIANKLCKRGILYKSYPPDKNATIAFYIA